MYAENHLENEQDTELSEADLKGIGERLKDLRTKAKLTQGDIAKGSGEHQSMISDIERGYRRPSIDLLVWLARHYQVSADYLIFGNGPDQARGPVCAENRSIKMVRSLGDAHGLQTTLEEIGDLCIPEKFFTPSTFALEVMGKGNEPTIRPGAIIGIDEADKTMLSGEFYLFNLREGYTVSRAFTSKESILLRKENPTHPEIQLPLDRFSPDTIVGRVKWVFQEI